MLRRKGGDEMWARWCREEGANAMWVEAVLRGKEGGNSRVDNPIGAMSRVDKPIGAMSRHFQSM
eukprot:191614-Chlamydomonas_euryale.AAC.9